VTTVLYHTNLGAVYLAKKQYEEAETEFKTALRLDPTSPQALSGLAMLEEGRGNLDQALEYLQTVMRQESGSTYATFIQIAELFIRMGKPADGAAYLNGLPAPSGQQGSQEIGRLVGLGMLYASAGRSREAEAVLLRALADEPTSVPAMQELFALYDQQGRTADLKPMLETALRKNPRSAMHHIWLGLVFRRQNRLDGAEREFKRAVEVAPELAGALANLGSLYLQQGRVEDAVAVLQRALGKDSRNAESRTNLIVALGMMHDLEGARQLVKDAEKMSQKSPLFYNALAYALHFNGRSQEALETLSESLRIDPRQQEARRLQAEIEGGRPGGDLPYR